MANPSTFTKDDKNWEEEFINSLASKPIGAISALYYADVGKEAAAAISPLQYSDIQREASLSPLTTTIEIQSERTRQILYRVPPQVRENKNHPYDPTTFTFGPYHHGRLPQFREAEEFKTEVLNYMLGCSAAEDKGLLIFSRLLERVDEIRDFYGSGISKHDFDDKALAEMMLRDACFVLYFLLGVSGDILGFPKHCFGRLGRYRAAFLSIDLLMLENQIPFWVVKLLYGQIYINDDHQWEKLVCKVLGFLCHGRSVSVTRVPWDVKEPLHLLEAFRATLLKKDVKSTEGHCRRIKEHCRPIIKIFKFWKSSDDQDSSFKFLQDSDQPFRSVTDLKAKGIHFGPSSTCLTDIKFTSYGFYAELLLPAFLMDRDSKVFFSNVIAFELSPGTDDTDLEVTSYVNFMKALLESPNDVKELREKGILFSVLNDEQVMKMFKELDTFGQDGPTFEDTKNRINKHCASKAKIRMAELVQTYFRSPWTAMALFTGAILLCLTFLQTFYTINQHN